MTIPASANEAHSQVKVLRMQAASALQNNDLEKASRLLAIAKSLRTPLESLDYLRAMTFLKQGNIDAAREAAKEELRYYPSNKSAMDLLASLPAYRPQLQGPEEFKELCSQILPYTMVGPARLQALYEHAVDICHNGPAGNFVECGVAGGGSSGLLSAVIKQHDQARHLYSCDSFSGMPDATAEDVSHDGHSAQSTGWGAGTCAAPESSVLGLCEKLGTLDVITTVKGYFEETLPAQAANFGSIAFLHMDGDWYESTKAILENLYDRLVPGAYVQVDDFGHWTGCRKALEDFCRQRSISLTLTQIDATGVWFHR